MRYKNLEIDSSLTMKIKVALISLFLVFSTSAYAEDNPFKLFDNHNFYKNKKSGIKPDGKIGDTCLEISKSFEKVVSKFRGKEEKLELVDKFKSSVDFIKFCIKEGFIKK